MFIKIGEAILNTDNLAAIAVRYPRDKYHKDKISAIDHLGNYIVLTEDGDTIANIFRKPNLRNNYLFFSNAIVDKKRLNSVYIFARKKYENSEPYEYDIYAKFNHFEINLGVFSSREQAKAALDQINKTVFFQV